MNKREGRNLGREKKEPKRDIIEVTETDFKNIGPICDIEVLSISPTEPRKIVA